MNIYTTTFWATCPANRQQIEYRLEIQTGTMVRVEAILNEVVSIGEGYHEDIADRLAAKFGGRQRLTANHHGVHIETVRPFIHHFIKPSEASA